MATAIPPTGVRNGVLSGLGRMDSAAVHESLRAVSFTRDEVLQEAGQAVKTLWFPNTGLVALMTLGSGKDLTATGAVGSEGIVGSEGVGDFDAVQTAVVQVAGEGFALPVRDAAELARTRPAFAALLHRASTHAWQVASCLVACERFHMAGEKVASWLVLAHDGALGGAWIVTHKQIAGLLSMRRSTVTVVVEEMRKAGTVTYTRGRLQVVDRARLAQQACTCMAAGEAGCEN